MDLANQKLAALKAMWEPKRGKRAMPSRADLHVSELRPWLGNLALIDLDAAAEGTFRLCGTNLFARFGRDVTGCRLDALSSDVVETVRICIVRVREAKAPVGDCHARIIDGTHVTFDELTAPLSDDGVHIKTLLFCSYPAKTRPE